MTYILSYFKKVKAPILVKRPWWAIFGHDRIEYVDRWERVVIKDIPEDEANILMTNCDISVKRLLLKCMGDATKDLQLESSQYPTRYMPTGGSGDKLGRPQV